MSTNEDRVLVVAPTGRDAELICDFLRASGENCRSSPTITEALHLAERGLGALVFADESLDDEAVRAIQRFRDAQPSWSDPPMIVLTRKGDDQNGSHPGLRDLGQISIIERPVGRRPLLSAVQAALRARMRQYEARAQMAELTRIGEELRIANSRKDELLGLVSHELRTPLTGILGCSDLLLRRAKQLPAADSEVLLRDINDHGKRLQRVIENMLVLSRAETALETNTEPLLLQRLLPGVLESLEPLKGDRRIDANFASDLPPVAANDVFVELVVTNLVRNSEKYSAENTDVEVRVEAGNDTVTITVADHGDQLDQTEVDRMFEVFYRDPDQSKNVSGLGLGLPVCKRLTEIQGGSIRARPRFGGGLEVAVGFPVVRD